MAGTNDFVQIAAGGGAIVEPQANWSAEAGILGTGFPNGIVLQTQYNKAWRQATAGMAAIGAHLATVLNENVVDNGTFQNLWAQLWRTMLMQGAFPDVGSANAYLTAAPAGLTFPVPGSGTRISLFVANVNTGASTFNWMGHGALAIQHPDGSAVARGEILGYVDLLYQGSVWILLSSSPAQIRQNTFGVNVDTLTVGSGTYTVPARTYLAQAILIGAGGGSSGSANAINGAVAGAGGGSCCITPPLPVTPGQTFSYVVGAGGVAVAYGATGGNGGTTTFSGGTYAATGGSGSSFAAVGFGGSATGGIFNPQGSPGMPYGAQSIVGASGGTGGSSAGPYFSGGGAAGTGIASGGGFPGGGAGGPGSGGATAGQVGGNGVIYVLR